MITVYIALGSNLDNPKKHIILAFQQLMSLPETSLVVHSSLYNTPPMGAKPQPNYINAVAMLQTNLAPIILFNELMAIEKSHGRHREGHRWDSRPLDLDILLYGTEDIDLPLLTIPHPGITTRAFVLLPLLEIAPDVCLPTGELLNNYLPRVDKTAIFIVDAPILTVPQNEHSI